MIANKVACSVEALTDAVPVDAFLAADLAMPTNNSFSTKTQWIREDLDVVSGFRHAVAEGISPELEEIAKDRGAMEWQVTECIRGISAW